MFTTAFALATLERALKTFVQGLLAFLITDGGLSIVEVDLGQAAGVSGLAALVSVLTSILSGAVTSQPGPSLVSAEVLSDPEAPAV